LARKVQQPGSGSEFDASCAQTPGRFLSARKYPSTRADIGLDAEIGRPRAQFRRSEISQQITPPFRLIDVPRRKIFYRLTVGEV
jgi:hypothetical protein